MIIGKKSIGKGGLLFVEAVSITACTVATFATGETTLQVIAVVAFVSAAHILYNRFKSLEK